MHYAYPPLSPDRYLLADNNLMPNQNRKHTVIPGGDPAIEAIELPLLLDAMFRCYGYDFRDYAENSFKRRLAKAIRAEGATSLSAFQDLILHRPEAMLRFLDIVTVETTVMFRDPQLYRVLRELIVPELRLLGPLRVWHAGCSTGEEVYSMALLLHEAGLLERTRIYATDVSTQAIEKGKTAVFPLKHMREYTANYQQAGGQTAFSNYYTAKGDSIILRDALRRNIVWAEHNLVTDSSFNEFQVICCRNVLIYFNRSLQDRVHRLLYDSLAVGGLLALGRGETIRFTPCEDRYEGVDLETKLYRKVA